MSDPLTVLYCFKTYTGVHCCFHLRLVESDFVANINSFTANIQFSHDIHSVLNCELLIHGFCSCAVP